MYIYLILGLVVNLIQLENTLRSSSGESAQKGKYVIFGVGAILGFFVYLASQSLLFGSLKLAEPSGRIRGNPDIDLRYDALDRKAPPARH